MLEKAKIARVKDKFLEDVGDSVKEEGGEWVPLSQPVLTVDPGSRDPI